MPIRLFHSHPQKKLPKQKIKLTCRQPDNKKNSHISEKHTQQTHSNSAQAHQIAQSDKSAPSHKTIRATLVTRDEISENVFSETEYALCSIISQVDAALLNPSETFSSSGNKFRININGVCLLVIANPYLASSEIIINPNTKGLLKIQNNEVLLSESQQRIIEYDKVLVRAEVLNPDDVNSGVIYEGSNNNRAFTELFEIMVEGAPIFESHPVRITAPTILKHPDTTMPVKTAWLELQVTLSSPIFEQKPIQTPENKQENDTSNSQDTVKVFARLKHDNIQVSPTPEQRHLWYQPSHDSTDLFISATTENKSSNDNQLRLPQSSYRKLLMREKQASTKQQLVVQDTKTGYIFQAAPIYNIDTKKIGCSRCILPRESMMLHLKAHTQELPVAGYIQVEVSWHKVYQIQPQQNRLEIEALIKEQLSQVPIQVGMPYLVPLDSFHKYTHGMLEIKILKIDETTSEHNDVGKCDKIAYWMKEQTRLECTSSDASILEGAPLSQSILPKLSASLIKGLIGFDELASRVAKDCLSPHFSLKELAPKNFIIIWGEPGNGKSHFANNIAKCIAKSNDNIVRLQATSLLGSTAKETTELLEKAFRRGTQASDCKAEDEFSRNDMIVYLIDEADRLVVPQGREYTDSQVACETFFHNLTQPLKADSKPSEHLTLKSPTDFMVIFTTNKTPDHFSDSLTRDGRFDYFLNVGNPEVKSVEAIIRAKLEILTNESPNLDISQVNIELLSCIMAGRSTAKIISTIENAIKHAQHNQPLSQSNTKIRLTNMSLVCGDHQPEKVQQQRRDLLQKHFCALKHSEFMTAKEISCVTEMRFIIEDFKDTIGKCGVVFIEAPAGARKKVIARHLFKESTGFVHCDFMPQGLYRPEITFDHTLKECGDYPSNLVIIEDLGEIIRNTSEADLPNLFIHFLNLASQLSNNTLLVIFKDESCRLDKLPDYDLPVVSIVQLSRTIEEDDIISFLDNKYKDSDTPSSTILDIVNKGPMKISQTLTVLSNHVKADNARYKWDIIGLERAIQSCNQVGEKPSNIYS
ncbi:ATP-binding protein [Parashewanella curva]|uniref:ATP-binding protein n=1 Tax=Parashewanella curva TaxID=2338552 RepID=A0A3L8PZJ3_9GAMM|nr:ATP-binding protein [Parashewanella curva]